MNKAYSRGNLLSMAAREPMATVYGAATEEPEWGEALDRLIPESLHIGVVSWVVFGILPGSFLQAVIKDNLSDAVFKADAINLLRIRDFVTFFHNYAPGPCFGKMAWKEWKGLYPRESGQ